MLVTQHELLEQKFNTGTKQRRKKENEFGPKN